MAIYKVRQEIAKHIYEDPKYYEKYTRVVEAKNAADAMVKFNKELISMYGKEWFKSYLTRTLFSYTKVERVG